MITYGKSRENKSIKYVAMHSQDEAGDGDGYLVLGNTATHGF